jgi:hypothetical protein
MDLGACKAGFMVVRCLSCCCFTLEFSFNAQAKFDFKQNQGKILNEI